MAKIEKSIFINTPVGKVFTFMAEPYNLLEIWPSLVELSNVKPLPNGGYCCNWIYKMAGLHFEGQAEWTEFVKDQRVVFKTESGIPSTLVWTYQPEVGGTRVSVNVEYSIPRAALDRLTEPAIQEMNEHESETILANLKARLEA